MSTIGIIFCIMAILVAIELLVHMIYHWKTGKAGLYDPPFEYLKDLVPSSNRQLYTDYYSGMKFYANEDELKVTAAKLNDILEDRTEDNLSVDEWYEILMGTN